MAAQQENQPNELDNVKIEGGESLPMEIRDAVARKVIELRNKTRIKRIYPIVIVGDELDEKPYYIGYFKRPDMPTFSMFMNKLQSDSTQASMMLAQNCFIEGDREMLSDDLFMYGTLPQLSVIIQNRKAELVKVSSVGK